MTLTPEKLDEIDRLSKRLLSTGWRAWDAQDVGVAVNALPALVAAARERAGQNRTRAQHYFRRDLNAPEDCHVLTLCERYGYGAVIDAACRLWARKDPMGAFYVGGCVGLRSDDEARAALEGRHE